MRKMAGNHTSCLFLLPMDRSPQLTLSFILSSQNGLIARWVAALPDHDLVLFLANWSGENDVNFLAAEKGGGAGQLSSSRCLSLLTTLFPMYYIVINMTDSTMWIVECLFLLAEQTQSVRREEAEMHKHFCAKFD